MKRIICFSIALPGFLLAGEAAPSSVGTQPGMATIQVPSFQTGGGGFLDNLGLNKASVDPSNEIVSWNGQNWNISNNRLFESQFMEYLCSPPTSDVTILAYVKTLAKIRELLSPGRVTPKGIDEAFRLLTVAAGFEQDANLCHVIASQVYQSWQAQRNTLHLQATGKSLERERSRLEWNLKMATKGAGLSSAGKLSQDGNASVRQSVEGAEIHPIATRLAEVETMIKKNDLNQQYTSEQARLDFQVLIVQLFLQRRFDHVLIAIDFYRSVFQPSSGEVRLGSEAMTLFNKTTGGSPTLSTVESAASEASQKVASGLRSVEVMLQLGQLQDASKRLAETFLIGQMMPRMQLVPFEQRQKVLEFIRLSNRLLNAIDVKDYAAADEIVTKLKGMAVDFDATKPNAAIQVAKLAAEMHLAKARNAAVSGDKSALETELQQAAEIWPTNPQLRDLSARIFAEADVVAQALADFDRLNSQKNYRQIYDDKLRFIAATAMYPDKQAALKKVLDDMVEIETAIQRSNEIQKRGDDAGAWESIEVVARSFPDDTKLNQFRANLTIKAATFVNLIQTAERYEKSGDSACALTAYLGARQIYPYSTFAKDGITRISKELLPDAQ